MVHDLESRLQNSKDNIEQILKIMAMWSKTPLFERSDTKNSTLLNLSDRDDRTKKRYEEIATHGAKIHELLQVYFATLAIDEPIQRQPQTITSTAMTATRNGDHKPVFRKRLKMFLF